MINARKIGRGYWKSSIRPHSKEGGKALILVSFTDFQKGGGIDDYECDKG